ncbi:MAG: hypothetical protein AABX34_05625 [Nanoarchaeota archaeon]
MYESKPKHLFLPGFHYALISLLALLIAVLFHELGHYLAAFYYELNPFFGINFSSIYVKTDFLDLKTHEIVSHAGPILNLIVAFFALIFFYIRGHKCSMRDYVCSILYLIPLTNILVAVFSLILFPFSGIL